MEILNTILFWAAVCLSVVTIYRSWLLEKGELKGAARELPVLSERTERMAVIVIVVIAVAVRLWRFGQVPGGFNQDGAMAAVDAKALADHGTDRLGMRWPVHLTAWGFGQMSALLSYLMMPLIRLFGLTPVTARLPLLVVSLAGLWCLYRFTRGAFGQWAGLAIFAFAAIDPWHILQSRWALDCNLYPHFFLFGIYFLDLTLRRDRRKLWLCLSMVSFGLCMYCYGVSIYTMPLFLLAVCIYLLKTKRVTWPEAGLALAVYLLVAWPFILTMAINTFGWSTIETPLFTIPFFPGSVRSADILFFAEDLPAQLMANLKSLVNITLKQVKDLPWNDVEGFGTMYLCSMPFAFVGLFSLCKGLWKKPANVFVLFFLLTGVWCGVMTASVNINRLNIIYYPILLLIGLGIAETVRVIPLPRLDWGVAGAYVLLFALFTHTYFTTYADQIAVHFFSDFTQATASLRDTEAKRIYFTPDGSRDSAYIGELLVLFFHEVDAEYYRGEAEIPGRWPYRDRYLYRAAEDIPFDPAEDAAYVIPERAVERAKETLPDDQFRYERFGSLYTVERRSGSPLLWE